MTDATDNAGAGPLIHPTAIVSCEARLGARVVVGPYAVIDGPAVIGDDTEIGAHAWICGRVAMGSSNRLFHGVVIGAEPQDLGYSPCESAVRIGDRNVFREYCTIHRGTQEGSETWIGSDCYWMALSHAGHNCRVGDRVVICNGVLLAGYVEVGDRAFISGNAMVQQFRRVGTLAIVSGGARVTRDAPPYTIVYGDALVRGLNVVGLRRAGIGASNRLALRSAFRTIFRSGLSLDDALERLDREGDPTAESETLANFLRTAQHGFCRCPGDSPPEEE
jgi:UDP-N-acetylglucosamine acyltransferase